MLKPFRTVPCDQSPLQPSSPAQNWKAMLQSGRVALWLARASAAPVSLRLDGSPRILAGLRVCATEPEREWILSGANSRDRVPPEGTLVQAVIRMEERNLTFQARVLGCRWESSGTTGARPMIRLGWPSAPPLVETRERSESTG